MIFVFIWSIFVTFLWLLSVLKRIKTDRRISEVLEKMIEGKKIDEVFFDESGLSLFIGQLKRISDKLDFEISRAEHEREQIKQMISNMSHQLKTPLANVMMYEELLDDSDMTEEKRLEFMKKLKSQTEKINWLLESLFKMSSLEQNVIKIEAVKFSIKNTMLNAINTVYEKAEKKNINVCMKNFEDVLLFHDPKWTSEVFVNLLENAVKYTRDGGMIELSVERLETYSIVHVRDNGIGIYEQDISHIFERFYRSKDAAAMSDGSGIGLYLSKIILEKERGYMTVASEVGRGSVFSVFLQNC